jgi:Ca2+/Na+ antiporter
MTSQVPFPLRQVCDVGITHKGIWAWEIWRRLIFFMCLTCVVIITIYTHIQTVTVWKAVTFVCLFFLCPTVLSAVSYLLNPQQVFRLFSRELNETSRRRGWRRRVFVCYIYRCGLILLTPCQFPAVPPPPPASTDTLHNPFKPRSRAMFFNRARWLDCNYVMYIVNVFQHSER